MAKTKQQLSDEWFRQDKLRKDALAKKDFKSAQKALAARNNAHAEADKLRKFQTETTYTNGKPYQTPLRMEGQLSQKATGNLPKVLPKVQPQITTAAKVRTGTLPKYTPPAPTVDFTLPMGRTIQVPVKEPSLLQKAFDPNENYLEKFRRGDISGGVANFAGTGLTAAQTLYLNAANSADSLVRGKGLPKFQPQMGFTAYDKSIAERRGTKPTIEQVSQINPVLGSAYQFLGEVGTDPLELTPAGYLNDIKLAKGLNQNSQAYLKALQGGKLNPSGVTATLPRANTPAPRVIPGVPRTITPSELPRATQPLPRVSDATVQPFLPQKGIEIPEEPIIAKNGDFYNPDLGSLFNELNGLTPLGADTNIFPPKIKVSEFKTNTLNNTPSLSDEFKAQLKDEDFSNPIIGEKQQLAEATQRIQADAEGEFKDLQHKENYDGVDATTAMELLAKFAKDGEETGDFSKAIQLAKATEEKIHGNAQSLQALAKYTRTPQGAIIEAQRVVNQVEKDIEAANPNRIKKVEQETKQVSDAIKKAKKETVESLGDAVEKAVRKQSIRRSAKLPMAGNPIRTVEEAVTSLTDKNIGEIIGLYSEASAKKIASKSDVLQKAEPRHIAPLQQAFDDLTKELYNIAQETLPKVATQKKEAKATDILRSAIENKQNYQDIWLNAKYLLQRKYANNPEAMQLFNDFFNKDVIPDFSKKTLDSAIKQTAKDFSADLNRIFKANPDDKAKLAKDIQDYILYKVGVRGEDAKVLADEILNQYNSILKAKTESALKQMFPEAFGKALPKRGQKTAYQKIMELINMGAYDNQSIRDVIKAKNKLPVLDNDDIKNIYEKMKQAGKQEEGSYAQRKLESEVAYIIANKVPADGVEKIQAAQRILMLLNPKSTLVRNPFGNAMLGALESVKNIPATGIDKLISLKTGQRTTTIAPLVKGKAELSGAGQGLKEWALDIKNNVNTSPTRGQVDLPHKSVIFSEDHNITNPQLKNMMDTTGEIGNGVHGVVSNMLQLGDRPFYQGAYNSRLAELKLLDKMNKTTTPVEEMKVLANEYALERTLQNDSWLSQKFLKLGSNKTDPKIWRVLVHLIMPFKQTPANILDKFIDYSGGGVLKAAGHALGTAGKGTFNQKYFVDTMGRGLTGTGLAALGYMLAQKGLATGGYDKNNKIENIETALGKQNYAFKIGDTYQTFDWALPASAPIAVGVEFYNASQKAKDGQNATVKGLESAVNLLFNSTVLQGPSKLMGGYSPAASIGSTLLGTTTQATPTVGKQLSQLKDPYVRETYDPNLLKQVTNKTIARIPFASETLPIKKDVFGNDVKAFQGKNNIFNVMINPGFSTTYKPDETQKELMRLYSEGGFTNQLPPVANKKPTIAGEKRELSADEYVKYQKTEGQYVHGEVAKLIKTQEYRNASDEEKAKKIEGINDQAKKSANMEYLKNKGLSPTLVLSSGQQEKYNTYGKSLNLDETKFVNVLNSANRIIGDKLPNGEMRENSESRNKKEYIDAQFPNATRQQLIFLYEMAGVSKTIGHYRPQFE